MALDTSTSTINSSSQTWTKAAPSESDFSGDSNSSTPNNSPIKKPLSKSMIAGLVVLALVLIGIAATLFLTRMNQDIRQQADADPYSVGVCCVNGVTIPGMTAAQCRAEAEQGGNATVGACNQPPGSDTGTKFRCTRGGQFWNAGANKCIFAGKR